MEISINVNEYNASVKAIKKANDRSITNSGNFKMTFDNSASNVISNYSEAIYTLKSKLSTYGEQLQREIDKLNAVRDQIVALDESLSK